jgi:hypothetical protein
VLLRDDVVDEVLLQERGADERALPVVLQHAPVVGHHGVRAALHRGQVARAPDLVQQEVLQGESVLRQNHIKSWQLKENESARRILGSRRSYKEKTFLPSGSRKVLKSSYYRKGSRSPLLIPTFGCS